MNRYATDRLAPLLVLLLATTGCSLGPVRAMFTGDVTARGAIKTILAADNSASPVQARRLPSEPRCATKIALIDVDGLLVNRNLTGLGSLGENPVALFREKLDAAAARDDVCAVVLRINSPGGGVTACDIMRRDLEQFRLQSNKPVVACLMDVGAGGAYYLATAADVIHAHPTTLTGGMGVIMNLYDVQDAMSQFNIVANTIRSGEKVDMGSPARLLEEDELIILERIAGEYHERYRQSVKQSRANLTIALPKELPETDDLDDGEQSSSVHANTIFDGRVFAASHAEKLGLVDSLGYVDEAIAAAEGLAGVAASQTIVFKRNNDRALTPYDITPNQAQASLLSISIPGLDRSQLPTFLYLWQPDPLYEKYGGP